MNFYKYPVAHRAVKGFQLLRKWKAQKAGPSREWRPEGAPTTGEGLPVLLENKGLSIAVFSLVFGVLRKRFLNDASSAYQYCIWFVCDNRISLFMKRKR